MAQTLPETFMDCLKQAEQTGDVSPLVALFADDAKLLSIVHQRREEGEGGAEAFWRGYLEPFERISSSFQHIKAADGLAVLEWTSQGRLKTGRDIKYQGVSLLETIGEKIQRFRTYYDSAAFLPDGAKVSAGAEAEDA
ncbi:MAG: nuclear transport factor 2 family protein [Phycisphaerae bacterium]